MPRSSLFALPLLLIAAVHAHADPQLFIGADEEAVLRGGGTALRWNIPAARSCVVTANGFELWGGTSGVGLTATYGGLSADTTYTLTCAMSSGGSLSGAVTVRVVNIKAFPEDIAIGGVSTISWDAPGATDCTVYFKDWALWRGVAGSGSTSAYGAIGEDTTYELRCATPSGTTSSFATVRVPVPVSGGAPAFANVRGANIFSGAHWFGDTITYVESLRTMHVNFARLVVNLGDAVAAGTEDDLVERLSAALDALDAADIKAVVTMGGYSTYELAPAPCSADGANRPPFAPFVDVDTLAESVFQALNDHPALYAYELQNEAISTQAKGNNCDIESTKKAVRAMYALLKSVDPDVPTTVSEAWFWWDLQAWGPYSSFWSYHIYPGEMAGSPGYITTPLNAEKLTQAGNRLVADINYIRTVVTPRLPVVLGEFGYQTGRANGLNPTEIGQFYQAMYDRLSPTGLNVGSFFWNVSMSDPHSIVSANGTFSPAAHAVTRAFGEGATFPSAYIFANPSTVTVGSPSTLSWSVPNARSCTVSANGLVLWRAVAGSESTSTSGNPTADTVYRLDCTMRFGFARSGSTTVYVRPR